MSETKETMKTEAIQAEKMKPEPFQPDMHGNSETVQKKKGKFNPRWLMIIGAILMVSTIFLPLASATEEREEYLEEFGELNVTEDAYMTLEDTIQMSVFKFGKLYYYMAKDYGSWDCAYTIWMALDVAFAVFVILTTIQALRKKPIVTMILGIISCGVFYVLCWDLADRGIVYRDNYQWSIAPYVYYVALVVVFVGAVATKMRMVKEKKQKKLMTEQM